MHIVSPSYADGNPNNLKNDCYVELKLFGYKFFKYRFDEKYDDSNGARINIHTDTSAALQKLNRAISTCLIAAFSIAIIILAFAIQQISIVREQRQEIETLKLENAKLKQLSTEVNQPSDQSLLTVAKLDTSQVLHPSDVKFEKNRQELKQRQDV